MSAKRDLAHTLVGDAGVASRAECLRSILKAWAPLPVAVTQAGHALVASVTASEPGFIAVGYLSEMPVMLIGRETTVTTGLDAQIEACLRAGGDDNGADDTGYERARRDIQRWVDKNAASDSAGVLAAAPGHRKRLLNRVDATLQNAPPHLRASRARAVARARVIATAPHSAAIEQELETFVASQMPDDEWLNTLASMVVRPKTPPGAEAPFQLRALLLLGP